MATIGNLVKKLRHELGVVEIYSDDAMPNPREAAYCNISKMVFLHKNMKLGDEHIFSTPKEFADFCDEHPGIMLLPVYIAYNKGIELSVEKEDHKGHLGYMYATPEMVAMIPAIEEIPEEDRTEVVLDEFLSELQAYNDFLLGNGYGFVAKDINGKEIGQGWGYMGDDFEANGLYRDAGIPD